MGKSKTKLSFFNAFRKGHKKTFFFSHFCFKRSYRIMIKNLVSMFPAVSHLIGNIYLRRFFFSFVCGGGIERLVSSFSFFDFSCWCTNDSQKNCLSFSYGEVMSTAYVRFCVFFFLLLLSYDQFNLAFVHHQPALSVSYELARLHASTVT